MDRALVLADPAFAAGMSAASSGIASMSSAICSAAGVFLAGFAASEARSRLCAKRRPCRLEAELAQIGGRVFKLQKKVRRQASRLATLKDVKKKLKKVQKKVGKQRALQKKLRLLRRQAAHPETSWEYVTRPTQAEAETTEAVRHAPQPAGGEDAVGIHCASTAGSSCAEAQVAGAARRPSEDRPNAKAQVAGAVRHPSEDWPSARDIESVKKLRAKHPGRIPVFCSPSAPSAASGSSACLQLKLLVPEHMSGADLKGALARKLSRGRSAPVEAQSLTVATGGAPLQAAAPLSQSFEAAAGFLHITYSMAG